MGKLKARETSLLSVLESNTDRWGEVRLTMDELSEKTEMSRTTLWRALVTLTDKGYVETVRTKRNLGRLYKNVYKVVKVETSTAAVVSDKVETSPIVFKKSETSTAGPSNLSKPNYLTTVTTKVNNTSYCLGRTAPEEDEMVNKWSEDDDLIGFGLIDEPVPVDKIKKIPKTRHLRPQSEWTANDVASEFTARVYDQVRGIPGMVNTRNLGIAMSTNRKKFGITAEQEMELLEKFFVNEQNLLAIKRSPKRTQNIFLHFITQNINDVSDVITIEQKIALEDQLEYIYASDGKKFLKSASGRQELKEYEEDLRG